MAVKTFETKGRIAAAAGVATVVLAVASFSWACTSGNEELDATPAAARAGDPVTFTGTDWLPGRVQIFLTTSAPQPAQLVDTAVQPDGTLRATATLPSNLSPGMYPITSVRIAPDGKTFASLTGNFDLQVLPTPQLRPQQPAPEQPAPQGQQPAPQQPAPEQPAPQQPAPQQQPVAQQPVAQQPSVPAQSADTAVAATPQPAPATAEVPAASPVEVAPTPEPTVGPPVATAPAPEDAWQPQETDPSLLEDRSSGGSSSGLLVGAGLLAVGSVALFAGFTVVVARRRRAPATSGL